MSIRIKNFLSKIFILGLMFGSLFFLTPQQMNAQVSSEAARLLRIANVQVLNTQISPQDFNLQLLRGGTASLSSYKGNVVLLNFWATWCPPCRNEMPSMEILYKNFKNQGLEILAIDLRENINTVRRFIQENRYTFPILLDTNGNVGSAYGIRSIPTTYIIDRQGMIIGIVNGGIDWNTPQIISAFEALLNSK